VDEKNKKKEIFMKISAEQNFIVKMKPLNSKEPKVYDNNGKGLKIKNGVDYIELGDIPITIRYSDFNKMFKGALTVIIQHTEQPMEITVETLDREITQTQILSGTPEYPDVGIFRLTSFIK
jgi:hypothetical protein